jgi:hypothetical protein
MFESKDNATLLGLFAYLLLVLAAPVGKLLGLAYFASLPWLKVTVLIWGPWLLGGVCWLLLGLITLGERLLEAKPKRDLPVPRP